MLEAKVGAPEVVIKVIGVGGCGGNAVVNRPGFCGGSWV
jgi:cell division GTPase FtsZ